MPEQTVEARLVFRPSETLSIVSLARFLGAASNAMLVRFASVDGVTLGEVARSHEVTCRTTFDAETGRPIYTLALVRREEVRQR